MLRAGEFAEGSTLGKYEIIKKLAVGGMAQIYLARVRGTAGFEKLVVLKRILPSVAEDEGFVTMFLDEARLAATLRHPNIADVIDVGVEDGSYYFAMEFIHGQDTRSIRLAAYELDRDIPIEVAIAIASGTAYALAYAHAKAGPNGPLGIVHRDISPSNILVSYDGAVKLVDFGIARANTGSNENKTRTGTLKGKVPYMSPEQCRGKALDRRSDLFSLGTVIYELTTGQRPFEGHSEYDTLEMIVLGQLTPPSAIAAGYPPELEAIVLRLMARDPGARYQDADTVLQDLERMVTNAGLLVSERVVARYMREVFADEIAEWEATVGGGTQPLSIRDIEVLATGAQRVITSTGEQKVITSTREYPDGRPPFPLLDDPPTVETRIDTATGEPMVGLLVTPEVSVFVRSPSHHTGNVRAPTPTPIIDPPPPRSTVRQPTPTPIIEPPRPDFIDEQPTTKAERGHLLLRTARTPVAPPPESTRLDTVLRFDPIIARGDDLLDEIDMEAPRDETASSRALRRITVLCARCAAYVKAGDFEQAVVAAELALEEPVTDEHVVRALRREQVTLATAFEAFLGDLSRPVIRDRPLDELASLGLDLRSRLLISRADGTKTLEDLLSSSEMGRFETCRQLCRLILRKVIVV